MELESVPSIIIAMSVLLNPLKKCCCSSAPSSSQLTRTRLIHFPQEIDEMVVSQRGGMARTNLRRDNHCGHSIFSNEVRRTVSLVLGGEVEGIRGIEFLV